MSPGGQGWGSIFAGAVSLLDAACNKFGVQNEQ